MYISSMKGPVILFLCVSFLAFVPVFAEIPPQEKASPVVQPVQPAQPAAGQPEAVQPAAMPPVQATQAAANLVQMTQLVWKTQTVRPRWRQPALPKNLDQKAWFFPGVGQAGLGHKARGAVQATLFSVTVAASISFFIAGSANLDLCDKVYDNALAEIDYTKRSNLLVQRDRYYNQYNILTSYGEASLVAAAVVYAYSIFDYYYSRKRERIVSVSVDADEVQLAYRKRF